MISKRKSFYFLPFSLSESLTSFVASVFPFVLLVLLVVSLSSCLSGQTPRNGTGDETEGAVLSSSEEEQEDLGKGAQKESGEDGGDGLDEGKEPGEVARGESGAAEGKDSYGGDATYSSGKSGGEGAGLSKKEIFRISREVVPERFLFIATEGRPTLASPFSIDSFVDAFFSSSGSASSKGGGEVVPARPIEDTEPLALFHDLDGNGYRDVIYILVEQDESLAEGLPESLQRENMKLLERQLEEELEERFSQKGEDGEGAKTSGKTEGESSSDPHADNTDRENTLREKFPFPEEKELLRLLEEKLLEGWYASGSVPGEVLAGVSRIYSHQVDPVDYYLSVFLQREDDLVSMYRIPLGSWKVFEDFASVEIVERAQMPFCVASSFQTAEGKKRTLVIFSQYNTFSSFTLTDTVSEHSELRDIDKDGVLDVVKWSQEFEEGTGSETFLSWYKWNGEKYEQRDTTNVVRNFNKFLSVASRLIQGGEWEKAFSHMMSPSDYSMFRSRGYTLADLFSLLFSDIEERDTSSRSPGSSTFSEGEKSPEKSPSEFIEGKGGEDGFKMVVFPRIMENPYRRYVESGESPPYRVRLSVRFAAGEGLNYVRSCEIEMSSNPFTSPQFFFVPNP